LTYITRTPVGLYPEFPQGRAAQRSFHLIAADPDQSTDLDDNPGYSEALKVLNQQLGAWLSTLPPPLTTQQKAYRELRKVSP
jgi:hypothetical protein